MGRGHPAVLPGRHQPFLYWLRRYVAAGGFLALASAEDRAVLTRGLGGSETQPLGLLLASLVTGCGFVDTLGDGGTCLPPAGKGAPCHWPQDCEDGLTCNKGVVPGRSEIGECRPPAKLGEACDVFEIDPPDCAGGLVCKSPAPGPLPDGVCAADRGAEGDACYVDAMCHEGLSCVCAWNECLCTRDVEHYHRNLGQTCGGPEDVCGEGLGCDRSDGAQAPVCAVIADLVPGAPCLHQSDCGERVCNAAADPPTCVDYGSLTEGAPCGVKEDLGPTPNDTILEYRRAEHQHEQPDPDGLCAEGLACDQDAALPTCVAVYSKAVGERCTQDTNCVSTRCFEGQCIATAVAGESCEARPCVRKDQCVDGVCVAPPASYDDDEEPDNEAY